MRYHKRKPKKIINRNFDKTYEDENGYLRFCSDNRLVHRDISYRFIYRKGFKNGVYKKRFSEYEIHHKDRDKQNNRIANLEILTSDEHKKIHRIK